MIAMIDYGMGNLRSVQKGFEKVGAKIHITQNPEDIEQANKIILPGVGAMQPAMERLNELNLISPIKKIIQDNKPFLGICLGLQLLFEQSEEGGNVQGLGILKGRVKRFTSLKVPHMGWNECRIHTSCPLFKGLENSFYVYFCHSYYLQPKRPDMTVATTHYGIEFTSAIWQDNVFGVQFHPEKSQNIGLQILKNFIDI